MKKAMISAIIGMTMMSGAICSASIPQSQFVIGEIEYGASINKVESVFGQPYELKRKHISPTDEKVKYEYANSIEFKFINGNVQKIEVSHNCDAKTSAGVGIGDDVAALEKVYGKADLIHKNKYIYFANENRNLALSFSFNSFGKIKKIKCGFLH